MRKSFRRSLVFLSLVLILQGIGLAQSKPLISSAIDEAAQVKLKGNTHPLARASNDRGAVADATPIERMLLVLRRDAAAQQALETRLAALHDPSSKLYHQWLTPAQFGQLYGANQSDLSKLTQWLNASGFTGVKVGHNGTVVEFSGTAGLVRRVFHTEMHQYTVQGRQYVANAQDPSVPQALSGLVAGFASLNNFGHKALHQAVGLVAYDKTTKSWKASSKPLAAQVGAKASPAFTTASSNGTLYLVSPSDFATIYGVNSLWNAGIDGSGQSIAVVARSNINTADVDAYRSSFGLPATKLNVIVNGTDPGLSGGSDEGEADLDVQWAGAVAKNATIDLVVSQSTSASDGVDLSMLYAVENNVAPILTVSYGSCELALGTAGNLFMEELWQQAAAQGITVSVATGDGGSGDCDQGSEEAQNGLQVNGIASTAYNVAVGGTDFDDWGGPNGVSHGSYWNSGNDGTTQASAKSYIPEMVWNSSCAGYLFIEAEGFTDGGTSCNSDLATANGFVDTSAGGGGVSHCTTTDNGDASSCTGGYDKPSWQNVAGVTADGKRDLPDVSLFAANGLTGSYLVYCQSDASPDGTCNYASQSDVLYLGGGGTSYAAPAFAGLMALVDQKMAARQGNANYMLYTLARSQFGTAKLPNQDQLDACNAEQGNQIASSCIFQDVVTGTNQVPCSYGSSDCNASDTLGVLNGYNAGTGFDLATGLGSVNAANLVNGWAAQAARKGTATALTIAPAQSTYGDALSYTITVTSASGTGKPSGQAILLANSQIMGTITLTNGVASGTMNGFPAGSYPVYAAYLGDDNYDISSSTTTALTVSQAATSTALVLEEQDPYTGAISSNSTVQYGGNVLAVATVSSPATVSTPTGTVNFSGPQAGSAALNAAGVATYTITGATPGTVLSYTASYTGDSNFKASASSTQSVTIVKANTSMRITPNVAYLTGSQNLTLTATAYSHSQGAQPGGTLYLSINGEVYAETPGSGTTDAITGGAALSGQFVIPATALNAGANTLTVLYNGDSNYNGSNGSINYGYSVTAPVVSNVLNASGTAVTAGAAVSLQAQVKIGQVPATAGVVSFYDGKKLAGTAQIVSHPGSGTGTVGSAVLTLRPAAGTHTYTARFNGTANVPGVVISAPVTVTAAASNALLTGTSLTAAADSANALNTDFTATVTGQGYQAPTGTVNIQETSIVAGLGSAQLDPSTATPNVRQTEVLGQTDGNVVQFAAVGDLNQDGIPDLVVRVNNSPSKIGVYLGKGDGTFQPAVWYTVGNASRGHGIAIGDVNGDGIPDVVTVNQSSKTVSVLPGAGDGTLLPAYTLSTGTQYPGTVRIADLNQDGVPDLFVTITSGGVLTFLGNGDGTFQPSQSGSLTILAKEEELADFNNDGIPDIAYTSILDPSIRVQLGKGDGTFDAANEKVFTITSDSSPSPDAIHAWDVNNDGKLDLVIADGYAGTAVVMLGNGDGTFGASASYAAGTNEPDIEDLAFGDFNNDGNIDLAAVDGFSASVAILTGNGDGTFNAPQGYFATLSFPSQIVSADLDGDGYPDLVQTSQLNGDSIAVVLLGGTSATATLSNVATYGSSTVSQSGTAVYAGDSNFVSSTSAAAAFSGSGKMLTPTLLWSPAVSVWGVGEPLGAQILNATVQNNVAGTLTYQAQLAGGSPVLINAASALPAAGSYTLTVIFSPDDAAEYTTATATVPLTVAAADFSITAGTSSTTLTNGSSATGTVSVISASGFSGAVNFSCSSTAPGISCSFSPAVVNGVGATTITLNAASAGSTTAMAMQREPLARGGLMLAGLFGLGLLLPLARRGKRVYLPLLSLLLAAALAVTGCGGDTLNQQTAITVSSGNDVAASGSTVTLTAQVGAHVQEGLRGNATFYDSGVAIGSAAVDDSGNASLTTNSLSVGVHAITASYTPSGHAQAAKSFAYHQVITGSAPVTVTAASGGLVHTTAMNVILQ
jgi:subtilase family serine protease